MLDASRRSFLKGVTAVLALSASGSSLVIPVAAAEPETVGLGWLLCNGQTVSRTEYAELFAVIGTEYGDGDGIRTFSLPLLSETPNYENVPEGTTLVVFAMNPREAPNQWGGIPCGLISHFIVPQAAITA